MQAPRCTFPAAHPSCRGGTPMPNPAYSHTAHAELAQLLSEVKRGDLTSCEVLALVAILREARARIGERTPLGPDLRIV